MKDIFLFEPLTEEIYGYESSVHSFMKFIYIRMDSPHYLVDRFFSPYTQYVKIFLQVN